VAIWLAKSLRALAIGIFRTPLRWVVWTADLLTCGDVPQFV
jgi:hypothetical protein